MARGDEEWKEHQRFLQGQAHDSKEHPEVRQDARDILVDMSNDPPPPPAPN